MKLTDQPRIELLYKQTNLIIPFHKDFTRLLNDFLSELGQLDLSKDYVVTIAPQKARRTLDANAYYWQLCRKISRETKVPLVELHNRNLAYVGIAWTNEDGKKHWLLQPDNDFWLKQKEIHFSPTDRTEDRKGNIYRWFYLLKPSHEMDKSEMSMLIDSVVEDAKSLGIETLTPDELARLKATWGDK